MTKLELIDKKEQLEARLKELITDAEAEHRKLSEIEDNEYNKLKDELLETRNLLNKFIDKPLTINTNKTNTMETRQFSILRAINEKLNGQFTEETRAVIEAGKSAMSNAGQSFKGDILIPMEERAITITGGDAGVVKTVEKTSILEPLRNSLVMVNAGATYLSNLKGDVAIPSYSGSNVGWASEVGSASDGKGTFKEVVLKPKRLTAILDVSKQFLIQDSVDAENMLRADLAKAIAEKLEQTILGSHTHAEDKPDGLFTGTAPADKGAMTFARLVDMEAKVEEANAGGSNMCYIMSPKMKAKAKVTQKGNGLGMIYEADTVNGYKVLSTNSVAKGLQTGADEYGVVFGDFSNYVIGQWGALDITVDGYTKAADGQVRLVVNAYFDAKPKREDVFAVASMK